MTQKNNTKTLILSLCLVGIIVLMLFKPGIFSSERVTIESQQLEEYLIELGYDTRAVVNGSMLKEDADKIRQITLQDLNLKSTRDLKGFKNLESLTIHSNDISHFDIRGLAKLHYLDAQKNKIKSFSVDEMSQLRHIDLSYNDIDTLQIHNQPVLQEVIAPYNALSFVDVKNNIRLQKMHIEHAFSQQSKNIIQIASCPELKNISAAYANFTDVHLTELARLYDVNFFANRLQKFSAETIYSLQSINIHRNQELGCVQLARVEGVQAFVDGHQKVLCNCSNYTASVLQNSPEDPHQMQQISLELEKVLLHLGIDNLQDGLIRADVIPQIKEISLSYMGLDSLPDLSALSSLVSLDISHNNISELDLSTYANLRFLKANNNAITTIAYNSLLEYVDLSFNSIDGFLGKEGLSEVNLSFNDIAKIDFTSSQKLRRLNISHNKIMLPYVPISMDISEIPDDLKSAIGVQGCSRLVQLVTQGNIFLEQGQPPLVSKMVKIPDPSFRAGLISMGINFREKYCSLRELSTIKKLFLYNKKIEDISGIEFFTQLEVLHLEGNLLSSIDLSQNRVLRDVYLDHNLLQRVVLPKTTTLQRISVVDNLLESLAFPVNARIVFVDVSQNKLRKIILPTTDQLRSLVASRNNISTFPDLGEGRVLKELDLSHNNLEGRLSMRYPRLESLDVSFNDLSRASILNLPEIKKVSLLGNPQALRIFSTKDQKKYLSESGFIDKEPYHVFKIK